MKYEVGQIVYLLNNQEMKIFPARIEEEVVRRRVGSEVFNYKVALPTKSHNVVDLNDLDVTVYTSAGSLRDHMVSNAVKTIDSLIERATRAAKILSEDSHSPAPVQSHDESDTIEEEEET